MTANILEKVKDLEIIECSKCKMRYSCSVGLNNIITELVKMGVEDYRIFVIKCNNYIFDEKFKGEGE